MRTGWIVALAGLACAPHDRDDEWLSAPAVEAVPEAPAQALEAAQPGTQELPEPCESRIADAPTALFGDTLLIRPPYGAEIVEENPTLALTLGASVSTCGATLRRAMILVFANDRAKSLDTYADEFVQTLEKNGYAGARHTEWRELDPWTRRGVVEVPAITGSPSVTLMLQARRHHDVAVTTVFYEALPEDFARLEPSLGSSADSILLVPPEAD